MDTVAPCWQCLGKATCKKNCQIDERTSNLNKTQQAKKNIWEEAH